MDAQVKGVWAIHPSVDEYEYSGWGAAGGKPHVEKPDPKEMTVTHAPSGARVTTTIFRKGGWSAKQYVEFLIQEIPEVANEKSVAALRAYQKQFEDVNYRFRRGERAGR